ncbi:MAG: hypothetical protein WCX79_00875 [Candidatus Paceibacterota bacterium]|jgi:hypothetical protein
MISNGIKLLIPVGSITGDPIGSRRYMEVDPTNYSNSVSRNILILPDGSEWVNLYQNQ